MSTAVLTATEEQVVVLELEEEAYGVEIGRVQEIIRTQTITRIPNGPDCVEGVINLRGRVIPVIDLHKRFNLRAKEPSRRSRIVVAELGEHTVGLTVDGVSEVLRVSSEAVEPPSTLVASADASFLRGVAKIDERLILLLDLAHILTSDEQETLASDDQ